MGESNLFSNVNERDRLLIEHHCQKVLDDLLVNPVPSEFVERALAIFQAPGAPKLTDPLWRLTSDGPEYAAREASALLRAATTDKRMIRSRKISEHFVVNPSCVLEKMCMMLAPGASPHKDEALLMALQSHMPANALVLSKHGARLTSFPSGGSPTDSAMFTLCAQQSNAARLRSSLYEEDAKESEQASQKLLRQGLKELEQDFLKGLAAPTDWIPSLLTACLRAEKTKLGKAGEGKQFEAIWDWAKPWLDKVDWATPVALESNAVQQGSILYSLMPSGWMTPLCFPEYMLSMQHEAEWLKSTREIVWKDGTVWREREIIGAKLTSNVEHQIDVFGPKPVDMSALNHEMKIISHALKNMPTMASPKGVGGKALLPSMDQKEDEGNLYHDYAPGWGSACAMLLWCRPVKAGQNAFMPGQIKVFEQAMALSGYTEAGPHWDIFCADFTQRAAGLLFSSTEFDDQYDPEQNEAPLASIKESLSSLHDLSRLGDMGGKLADRVMAEMMRQAPLRVKAALDPVRGIECVVSDFVEGLRELADPAKHISVEAIPLSMGHVSNFCDACVKLMSKKGGVKYKAKGSDIASFECFSLRALLPKGESKKKAMRV